MVEAVEAYHNLVRRDVFPHIPLHAGRVLDFGGGVGATSGELKREGRADKVVLFDQVAESALSLIDFAESLDLEDHCAIAAALERHGPFDTILCLDILEHLRDPWKILRLLSTALLPSGTVIISIPNLRHYSVVGPLFLRGKFDYVEAGIRDRTHLRWFTRDSAQSLVTDSGMRLEKIEPNIRGRRNRLLSKASFGLLDGLVATQYTLRARPSIIANQSADATILRA